MTSTYLWPQCTLFIHFFVLTLSHGVILSKPCLFSAFTPVGAMAALYLGPRKATRLPCFRPYNLRLYLTQSRTNSVNISLLRPHSCGPILVKIKCLSGLRASPLLLPHPICHRFQSPHPVPSSLSSYHTCFCHAILSQTVLEWSSATHSQGFS